MTPAALLSVTPEHEHCSATGHATSCVTHLEMDAARMSLLPRSPEWGQPRPRLSASPKSHVHRYHVPHPLSQPPVTSGSQPAMASPSTNQSSRPPSKSPESSSRRFSSPALFSSGHGTFTQSSHSIIDHPQWSPSADSKPGWRAHTAAPQPKRLAAVKAFMPVTNDAPLTADDQTWRTMLSDAVDVESLGPVSVARFMAEVWRRGGPTIVSERSLWSDVLMSLSQPLPGSSRRAPLLQPTADLTLALQALYNVAIRPNEVAIFAGFLASIALSESIQGTAEQDNSQVCGAWTPTKGVAEIDLSQWTTLTPGAEWPSLGTTLAAGSGLTPRGAFSPANGPPPTDLSATSRPASRTGGDGIQAINDILAQLEDNEVMRTNESEPSQAASDHPRPNRETTANESHSGHSSSRSDTVATPVDTMVGAVSPFMSAASLYSTSSGGGFNIPAVSGPTSQPPVCPPSQSAAVCLPAQSMTEPSRGRQARALQLDLPTVPFIPPPPMCMFFSPAFRDLQTGKVGMWKGDLTVRGRGGGTFNILIVGEQGSDNLWQSHLWGDSLTYPPGPVMTESCTATMIPVSTLAREGLLPVSMGMVLCNDENIAQYVAMVQGLHAEGVAFHLPGSTLPIVFLPAKFDSADPLQRLGVAFMTKGGIPPVPLESRPSSQCATCDNSEATTAAPNRRRRKSSSAAKSKAVALASTSPKLQMRKPVPGRLAAKGAAEKSPPSAGAGKAELVE